MLRKVLLATLLLCVASPVLRAKERILLHRIGPSESTLFIAKTDGSDERPLLPNSGFDYNALFSADGKWIVFTSERGGSADIYRVHTDGSGLERLTDDPAYDDQLSFHRMENSLPSCPPAVAVPLTFGYSTCKQERRKTLPTPQAISGRPGHQTGNGSRSHRTVTPLCGGTANDLNNRMLSAFI